MVLFGDTNTSFSRESSRPEGFFRSAESVFQESCMTPSVFLCLQRWVSAYFQVRFSGERLTMTPVFWYYITMIKIIRKHGLSDWDFLGGLTLFLLPVAVHIMN